METNEIHARITADREGRVTLTQPNESPITVTLQEGWAVVLIVQRLDRPDTEWQAVCIENACSGLILHVTGDSHAKLQDVVVGPQHTSATVVYSNAKLRLKEPHNARPRRAEAEPVQVEQEIGETQRRVLDILASAHDEIVEDVLRSGVYSGPDASLHAKNQADRELLDVLVQAVRSARLRQD
jgi:hypothetical protein